MDTWVEQQQQKIEDGKQAESELGERIATFLTATSREPRGSVIYGKLKLYSIKLVEESGEKFIIGQISISKEHYGTTSDGFKINVDALNDIDETLRKVSEFNRLAGY